MLEWPKGENHQSRTYGSSVEFLSHVHGYVVCLYIGELVRTERREERRDMMAFVLVLCWLSKNSIALSATNMSVGVTLYCVAGEERKKRDMSLPLSSLSFVLVGRRFVNVYLR